MTRTMRDLWLSNMHIESCVLRHSPDPAGVCGINIRRDKTWDDDEYLQNFSRAWRAGDVSSYCGEFIKSEFTLEWRRQDFDLSSLSIKPPVINCHEITSRKDRTFRPNWTACILWRHLCLRQMLHHASASNCTNASVMCEWLMSKGPECYILHSRGSFNELKRREAA